MNCNNCTNSNALKEVKIKHVHGNMLRMAIPLTLRTIELVDGEINATDTPFIPSSEHPVKVVFSKGSVSVALDATMKDGNIAYIEEKGKIPVGTYAITVTCNDDNGNPYRFKQNAVLYVADATIEAGIEETIEYEVTTWYLDAAIFLALKGEDGVGIYDIETQSSGEIGGVNTVTFILTDGRTRSFDILNGSGATDSELDINSPSPIANSAVTAKFNELAGELADLFGDVDYDTSSKSIRFWDKGKTNVLASLDARPFIKDGMVSNVYISNNTLVITFNTDSGKEAIGVPLTSVFNPNNYYTKTQVDSRIASAVANINLSNYYTKAQIDAKLSQKVNLDATTGRVDASQATRVVLDYIVGIYDGEDEPSHEVNAGDVWYDNGQIHYAYNNDVTVVIISLGAPQKDIIYCNAENNKLYRWNGSEFVQVGGSGSGGGYEPPVGGIPKSDLAQSVQDTLDDVSNKVDKVAGKGLSTEDYTTAEKQKLAGLSNYDDTEIQAEVDAKYEKPSTGIPKSDLASGVQSSLDAADSAYQKPNGGIPKTDLSNDVQTSLGKADTALQSQVQSDWNENDTSDPAYIANKPSIPEAQVNSDWNASSGVAQILNKPTIPTVPTNVSAFTNDAGYLTSQSLAGYATEGYVSTTIAGLVDSAPQTLDTLNELAEALGDDPNFATTMATQLGNKVDKESGKSLMTDAEHTKLAGIDPSTYATKTEVNAKQDTINDLDAIRSGAALGATALQSFTETDPNVPDWAKQQTKPTYTAQEVGALPASTTIPSKTSDLTNDSGFIDKAMYYGESTTAAATMPKVCTVETFPTTTSGNVTHAKEGTIIAVKFTNSDTNTTDAPKLNVNGIGAKAIMYNNAIVTSTAKNTTVAGTAKMLAYYRYDPALDEGNGAWEFLAKSVDSNSTYSNASLGQGYGTQSNSAAATAITSSISSYALSAGGIVTIKFTYDVPANATLNINSKGAKAIYNQGAAITAGVIKAGDTATFVYSTYYHLIAVDSWQDKQDAISDLATIRSGAAAGATAAQPADIPTKVSDLTNDAGYTTNTGTVTGISVNGGATQQPTNGVVSLTIATGGDNDIVGISDGTASDGAVVFSKRNGDTVTLDFNHSHPQYALANSLSTMAKLVVCKESELPSTLDNSTIYAITDSGETNLVKFIIRGMEFAGGGGSSSLPYDAEIEYLQTTGTQYIDTGVVSGTNIVAEIKAILTQTSSDVQTFLCARTGDNAAFSNLLSIKNVSTPYVQIGSGTSSVDSSADPTVLHTYRTGLQNNSLFFETDGTTEGTRTISGSTSDLSLYLFARHTDSGVDRGIYSKLYYCKITKNGSLVRDFIPVRVGQTGYLYDRVSGELFGNDGTGSFTLGNDKS